MSTGEIKSKQRYLAMRQSRDVDLGIERDEKGVGIKKGMLRGRLAGYHPDRCWKGAFDLRSG